MANNSKKIISFQDFINSTKEADSSSLLHMALDRDHLSYVSQRLNHYHKDFLKLTEYSKTSLELHEISNKIVNLKDSNVKDLFTDYQHQLEKLHLYEASLSYVLGLTSRSHLGYIIIT